MAVELRDPEIRAELRRGLMLRLSHRDDVAIVDEMGIQGGFVRADLAMLRPERFVGYEIKSDFDSLKRLPRQQEIYELVFDHCYVICGEKYAHKTIDILPEWWGVYALSVEWDWQTRESKLKFKKIRTASDHDRVDINVLVDLFWRDELLGILRSMGLGTGLSAASKRVLRAKVLERCDHAALRSYLVQAVKVRDLGTWQERQ